MSMVFAAMIRCDFQGCMSATTGQATKSTELAEAYWIAKRDAEKNEWSFVNKGKLGMFHYCRKHSEPVLREIDYASKKKKK